VVLFSRTVLFLIAVGDGVAPSGDWCPFGSYIRAALAYGSGVLASNVLSFPSWASGDVVGEFFDPVSGRLLLIARPAAQPDLWAAFVDGARVSYAQHGVEGALDYDGVRDGLSSSLFVAAVEHDGRVVGGLRVQGPYTRVEQTAALGEWAGRGVGGFRVALRVRRSVLSVCRLALAASSRRTGNTGEVDPPDDEFADPAEPVDVDLRYRPHSLAEQQENELTAELVVSWTTHPSTLQHRVTSSIRHG